jgi:hypothetical protein
MLSTKLDTKQAKAKNKSVRSNLVMVEFTMVSILNFKGMFPTMRPSRGV